MIDYSEPPCIGTELSRGARTYRLEAVEPYVRKRDGAASFVLHWRDDRGFHWTSGLRAKSLVRMPK